jgi:HflK protein
LGFPSDFGFRISSFNGMNARPPAHATAGSDALGDALQASFRLLRWLMALLALAYLASGVFVVRQHEMAVVLNLGRVSGIGPERVKAPGIHWTLPAPFSEVVRVPAARVATLGSTSFWHRAVTVVADPERAAPARSTALTLPPDRVGYALAGDNNIVHSRWAVRYTIDDPEPFLFRHAEVESALKLELDRAVTLVTGRMPVDRALRTDLEGMRAGVQEEVIRRSRELGLGLRVQGVDLLDVAPPDQVADSFDAVITADQSRDEAISQARAYAGRLASEAQGEAGRLRYQGESYRQRVLSEIRADADAFQQVYAVYTNQPAVIRATLLQDSLRRTLAGLDAKYIVPSSADGMQELRIQLGPEMKKSPGAPEEKKKP